ncbi:dnaJ homolog subfamily C member 1 [Periophthalmus magnuspinnatus]|uniref:dnaJ homolog subfamily C member 1 n=1 Tax=Periophthalmus magnuspinnatus TaxID=409849 RepID=UPI0024371827|nr:dnaJ homolog subfamily C member 1 [Periophthalmus magnuspinnatus]
MLSVGQDAAAGDIKKAYRRLSLVLHPDKNKEPDAEDRFRQLVAVYEVLKDEERRKRYDEILEHGLPDWRQPVFYYRRVRKMSNTELCLLLFIIFTVGHYTVLWSIYLEKILDDLLSRKKREKKKKTTSRAENDRDDRCDRAQERPHWQDLLPLKLSMWLYVSLRNLPQTVQELKCFYEEQQLMKKRLREEQEKEQEPQTRERKVKVKKPKVEFPVYDPALENDSNLHGYDPMTSIEEIEDQMDDWLQEKKPKKVSDWSEEELSLLSRLMVKFPGGTPGRWERIAHELNRTVAQVTTKVKQVKEHVSHTPSGLVKLSELKAPPPVTSLPADDEITQREGMACDKEGKEFLMRKRNQSKARGRRQADFDPEEQEEEEPAPDLVPSGLAPSGPTPWTQNQQRLLELALQQFPRGTAERWTRIAAVVPGKTKDECMSRYKTLAELVQKRKQAKTS